MTTVAKIKCCNCDNSFSVYWTSFPKEAIQCPHCFATMDEHMSEKTKNVLGAVNDVNYHFLKYQEERNEHRFEINIEEVHVPPAQFRIGE